MPFEIRPLGEAEVAAAVRLAVASPAAAQWSEAESCDLLRHGAHGWLAIDSQGTAIGFLVARETSGEAEILNLAVDTAHRRQGIASALMRTTLDWARGKGISILHLEVRAANFAARQFYEAQGFRQTGLRRRYYRLPPDDAVLLSLLLSRD